jgi:Ca-activated chloride channel family protein
MDNIVFKNPEFFWLFLILPVLLFFMYRFRFKKTNDLKVSYLRNFKSNSLKTSLYPTLSILRILSIGLIITALARPQTISNTIKSNTKLGIDIVIAVDVSGSMLAKDLKPDRLEALKSVASEFIKDRINDRIGLVIYAGESYTKTPVTSDKEVVINSLNELS